MKITNWLVSPRMAGRASVATLAATLLAVSLVGLNAASAGTTAGTITTIAGTGTEGSTPGGGLATAADLGTPNDVVTDAAGNVFIADWTAHVVRMIAASDCTESCVFGLEPTTAGHVYTLAGNGTPGNSGDSGSAGEAELASPSHLVLDAAGDLLITDDVSNVIRLVAATSCASSCNKYGLITPAIGDIYTLTLTDSQTQPFQLNDPRGITVGSGGGLYIADFGANEVLQVADTNGSVNVLAGTGDAGRSDGPFGQGTFDGPISVVFDPSGHNLFVADSRNNLIRQYSFDSYAVSTVVGTGTAGYAGDGAPANQAQLFQPDGMAVDSAGDLFIADVGNNVIREVASATPANTAMTAGYIYTVAGTGAAGSGPDGVNAANAQLRRPDGVALDASGNLDIADSGNHLVRQVGDIAHDTGYSTTDTDVGSPYARAVLADAPSVYYRLDEGSGSMTAVDFSGGHSDGTYQSAAALGVAGALPDEADTAAGNGTGGAIATASDAGLPAAGSARTVEGWIKLPKGGSGNAVLVDYGLAGTCGGVVEFEVVNNGTQIDQNWDCNGVGWNTPFNLYDGTWHLIDLVIDGAGNDTVYLDGTSLGTKGDTGTYTVLAGTNALQIGNGFDTSGAATVDEVAIYPTALTAARISAHVAASVQGPNAPTGLSATAGPNAITAQWTASATDASHDAPLAYRLTVTSSAGNTVEDTTLAAAVVCASGACQANLSGIPTNADPYTVAVAGVDPYWQGPAASTTVTVGTGSATATSYSAAVLADHPSVYYRLDEPAGSAVARDGTVTGDEGQYQSAAALGVAGALPDEADTAAGNGTGGAIATASDAGLPAAGSARTVEGWIKLPKGGSGNAVLVDYGLAGTCGGVVEFEVVNNGTQIDQNWDCNGVGWNTPFNLYDGTWHLIDLVIDGAGNDTVYLDGTSLGTKGDTGTYTVLAGTNALQIGNGFDTSGAATVDEVAIYPTALTAARISAHVAASVQGPNAPTGLSATAGPNAITAQWTASATDASHDAPLAYRLTVTSSAGNTVEDTTLAAAVVCASGACQANLSGIPTNADPYTVAVAGVDPYWQGPAASTTVTVGTGSATATSYSAAVLADHPSVYYRLDEPAGSQKTTDYAGNSPANNGTYWPAATLGQSSPITSDSPDTAVTGDGSGPVATASDAALPTGNAARTIEAWFELPTNTSGCTGGLNSPCNAVLAQYGGGGCGTYVEFGVAGNGTVLSDNDNCGGLNWTAPANLHDGAWHHAALVIDGGGQQTLYLDGNSLGTQNITLGTTLAGQTGLSIGAGFDTTALKGSIDEVAIYPTALTADRLNAHYTAASAVSTPAHVAPSFTAASPPAGVVGAAYSYTFAASGSPAPTFMLSSGSLPAGLALDSTTGVLSGTPSTAGPSTFTVSASNGTSPDASSGSLTITVTQAPSFTAASPPAGVVGAAYSYTFAASGSPAPTFMLSSGSLPAGLALDSTTGVLSGTPSTAGPSTFTVSASNGTSPDASSGSLTITVTQAPSFTAASPPAGVVGAAYSYTFAASGSPAPTFMLSSGSLPAGLALDSTTGVLSGTPSTAGPSTFTVSASNGTSPDASSGSLTITVVSGGGGGGGGTPPAGPPAPPAPPAGSTSSASGSSSSASGTASATDGDTTATGDGAGSFTVAHYGDDPTPAPLPSASEFLDVKTGHGSSFTSLTVTVCVSFPAPQLEWFNPTANAGAGGWEPVIGTPPTTPSQFCVTITLSPASSPSLSRLTGTVFAVTKTPGYVATGPTRVLDTRGGTGAVKAPVGAKQAITLTVPNLPAGTTAAVLNLTGTGLTGAGTTFVSACPAAQKLVGCTKTSALNITPGRAVANELIVPVASDGKVTLYNNAGSIDLVADLVGYQTGGYSATGPTRVLDTRGGTGAVKAPVGAKQAITLTVPGLPAGATGVVLNLTGTGLTGSPTTYVSVCPAAQKLSDCTKTSALNVIPGVDVANEVIVPVASDGKVTLYNNAGSIDLVADLVGFQTGGYTATGPTRVLDTRSGTGAAKALVGAKQAITLTVPSLPAGTTGVVLNLTGTGLTGAGTTYVSACPAAQKLADCTKTSALNVLAGKDVANEVIVPVASDGKVTLYNNAGSIGLVADLVGYQTGS